MFKEVYSKANECITNDELKNKILNPQVEEKKTFKLFPRYSYATIMAAAVVIVLFLSGNNPVQNQAPVVMNEKPVQNAPVDKGATFENPNAEVQVASNNIAVASEPVYDESVAVAEQTEFGVAMLRSAEPVAEANYEDVLYGSQLSDKSFVVSPFSLESAMSIVLNGAENNTKNSILNAFGIVDEEQHNQKMQAITNEYNSSSNICTANSVWLNKDRFPGNFNQEFSMAIAQNYSAESNTLGNADGVSKINNWVNEKTNGKISEMIDNSDFDAIILNAVYFNAKFENEFDPEKTYKGKFTGNGVTYDRDFMREKAEFLYGENNGVEIVKMPYVKEGNTKLSLYVMKSDYAVTNPVYLIENTPVDYKYINLHLPKFEVEYETELTDSLSLMGVEGIQLDKMASQPLSGVKVIQKAYVSTQEKGTEAAAATGIVMMMSAFEENKPYELKFDKDFTFVVYDETNNIVLFAGEIK